MSAPSPTHTVPASGRVSLTELDDRRFHLPAGRISEANKMWLWSLLKPPAPIELGDQGADSHVRTVKQKDIE